VLAHRRHCLQALGGQATQLFKISIYKMLQLNKRPPYWNSVCGFDFDIFIVISVPFCIGLLHFLKIRPYAAELQCHIDFSKMAAI